MSKVKSPQDKKELSLSKDGRNLYGECPTSSRKNIRRGKQRSHRELRRAASEELAALKGAAENLDPDEAEFRTRSRILGLEQVALKKKPDKPLAEAIKVKAMWRSRKSPTR